MLNLISSLSDFPAVSSREEDLCGHLKALCEERGYACRIDRMGNLIAIPGWKTAEEHPVLFAAHMDEPGLMIDGYTDDGCLKFDLVGNPDVHSLIGKHLLVGEEQLPGVIGIKAIHLTTREERKKQPPVRELYIDIGARDKTDAQSKVGKGETAAFARGCAPFGSGHLKGPALGRSASCAVLLKLMEEKPDAAFAFTVQQEVGSRGAFGAAFSVKPSAVIVVDGIAAGDFPGAAENGIKLGGGPVRTIADSRTIYTPALTEKLLRAAEKAGITLQTAVEGTPTQAQAMQRRMSGCPAAAIRIPVRYADCPANVADPADAEKAVKVLREYLKMRK